MGAPKVTYNHELDLAIYTFGGEIVFDDVFEAIRQYYQGKLTKYTLWDFSAAEVQKISNNELSVT